jgi:hypothetical protein
MTTNSQNSSNSHLEAPQQAKYVFPNIMAKAMAKIDMRTQYEASMLSLCFILVGLLTSVVYFVFYLNFATWYKVILVINGLAGFVFLSSHLVTTYQQYKNYMEIVIFQKQMKGG